MRIVPVALSLCLASIANAAVAQWGQCGGRSYTGDTVCAAGLSCVVLNDFYSQCLAGGVTTTISQVTVTPPPTATPSPTVPGTPTPACPAIVARSTGPPIAAITTGSPVYGLYVQRDSKTNEAILTTGAYGSFLHFANSIYRLEYIGAVTCQAQVYFNIHENPVNPALSYKPILWDINSELTTDWLGNQSLPIQTKAGVSKFLACKQESGTWKLYLQTGKDVPAGQTCALTELRVGLAP